MKISNSLVLPASLPAKRQNPASTGTPSLPPKKTDESLPSATPEQIESVLLDVSQRQPPAQFDLHALDHDARPSLARQAINAYESQTRSEQAEFVRSVVAGIDLFV